MIDVGLKDLQEKYEICEAAVDNSKNCDTCRHLVKPETD